MYGVVSVILHMSVITQDGWTPLMYAAREGRNEVVTQLLKLGAAVDLQNRVCCMDQRVYMIV